MAINTRSRQRETGQSVSSVIKQSIGSTRIQKGCSKVCPEYLHAPWITVGFRSSRPSWYRIFGTHPETRAVADRTDGGNFVTVAREHELIRGKRTHMKQCLIIVNL